MNESPDGLASALARVRARIDDAARAAGRKPASITLIAVTKTHPVAAAAALVDLGVPDLGENRVDELADKAGALAGPVRWHFVGQLQTNKVNRLVRVPGLHAVHSVDRRRLVDALARAVGQQRPEQPLRCFVQVDLDPHPDHTRAGRGGAAPDAVPELADAVANTAELDLAGLMAVAPLGADPTPAFAALAELSARVRADHPGATSISAGMSGDLESAIGVGATHVRVGTAILGARGSLR